MNYLLAQLRTADVLRELSQVLLNAIRRLTGFNPDFPLGLEMTTLNILMDFLWKFEGNRHSIDRNCFSNNWRKKDTKWTS